MWNVLKRFLVAVISGYIVTLVKMNNNHAENNLKTEIIQ